MSYTILVIEDDPLIAADLKQKLISLGYEVIGPAFDKDEVTSLVKEHSPQLLLVDIMLEQKEYDGVDLVREIQEYHKTPVIYLTANSEAVTVKRAQSTGPSTMLFKPFRLKELSANIDLAIQNFKEEMDFQTANKLVVDAVFVPENFVYKRVYKHEIIYAQADGSYTKVITVGQSYHLTLNLKNFEARLEDDRFMRISRSYLVNTARINSINGNQLYLDSGDKIGISRGKRQELMDRFPILKTGK